MKHFFYTYKTVFASIGVISLLLTFVLRQLLFNAGTHLFDWHDYPLYVWILYQNIGHWKQFAFESLFSSNIFYPFTNTLLFSDLLWPQSLMALPLTLLLQNPILVFNSIFFVSLVLNVVAAHYFWSFIYKNSWQLFFASLTTIISSFVFQNWYHFQIFNIWPFLFALGFFIRIKYYSFKKALLGGLLISIVFYSSIYLWVMLLTTLAIWYLLIALGKIRQKHSLNPLLGFGIQVISIHILLSGFTINQYWQTRQLYQAERDYGEYVTYSTHISDYLFPAHHSSIIWRQSVFKTWGQYNQHYGLFPGFTIVILAGLGLVKVKKSDKSLTVGVTLQSTPDVFFLILLGVGFVFSLGPRLSFNATYLELPLPYHFLLKTIPLFEVFRVTSRWSLLFFLGLTYFAVKSISRLRAYVLVSVVVIASILYLLEVYPFSYPTETRNYYPTAYTALEEKCLDNTDTVLLEYPIVEFRDGANISTYLSYRTQLMMASLRHGCLLVNGYSGYTPREYDAYEHELFLSIENQDEERFWQLLSERNINLVKLNKTRLYEDRATLVSNWLHNPDKVVIVYDIGEYLVVSLHSNVKN